MRTESVQLSSGSGYVQFYTPNASKISRGSAVYGISATENADTSGISADAATRTSLRSSLARFSSDYDSSSFSGIYQLKTELSAKLLAAAAENGDSSSQTIFYADQDGVVVYGSDGYESYTEDSLTPELFSTKASVVSFDSGAQTADAAYNQINFHACLAGIIECFNNSRITQGIHLCDNSCRATVLGMFFLALN